MSEYWTKILHPQKIHVEKKISTRAVSQTNYYPTT